MKRYDFVIIGAGSVGVPLAYYLSKKGASVAVLERKKSVGQGSNKAAIGGIRATHSNPAKIIVGKKSLELFEIWQEKHEIEWYKGGYSFVAYTEDIHKNLKELVKFQKSLGLEIDYLEKDELIEKIPSINPEGLLGGTYSPGDGSASPLLTINSFYREARKLGAEFYFEEEVKGFNIFDGYLKEVKASRETYRGDVVINAAGGWAGRLQ